METTSGQKSEQSDPKRAGTSQENGRQESEQKRRGRSRGGSRGKGTSSGGRRSPLVSVVIPLYNEEESLEELGERLTPVLQQISGGAYEVIFVDDGSTDASYEMLRKLHRANGRFKAIRFRANYGKSAALAVGFKQARGDYIFTMDADLQDDPGELPKLLSEIQKGFDLVSGWKKKRHDPWHKTLPSKLFNVVIRRVTRLKLHDFNCGLKVYRREVLPALSVYGEMHRYLPAQAHWQGFRVTELAVTHHPRKHGASKFGMSRLVKGFLDLMTLVLTTRYAQRPLHIFGTVGIAIATVGFLIDLWLTIEWFLGQTFLTNRPLALLGTLLIIVGVQLVSIGLIGEMVAKNALDIKEYSIRERLG